MRIIKTLLVAGMALYLTQAAFGNITMSDSGFGAVAGAIGMQTTFQHPNAMWRAIDSPALIWMAFGAIVLCEITGAILCWIGAGRMCKSWGSKEEFAAAKTTAYLGLGVAACLFFIGFLVLCQEYFLMWQSSELNVLPDAFRSFASATLIALWLNTED